MMSDKEFGELQLRATICPQQVRWPTPETAHWQRLHDVANEARERVNRAYKQMDEIDRNDTLSREDRNEQRQSIAAQAVAAFEASQTLVRARESVRLLMGRDDLSPEIAEATRKAMREAEAGWQKAIDMIFERAAQTKGPAPNWRAAKFRPHPVTSR
jgi:hypothetical protein